MNTRLMNNAKGWERILKMGFIEENDGSGDPRGIDYNMRKNGYHILIDPWFDVKMTYKDSDFIKLQVDDLIDLQEVIDFIECGD